MPYKAFVRGAGAKFYVVCADDADGQQLKMLIIGPDAAPHLRPLSSFELYYGETLADPPRASLLVDVAKVVRSPLPEGVVADADGSLHFFVQPVAGACVVGAGGMARERWGRGRDEGPRRGAVIASRPAHARTLCPLRHAPARLPLPLSLTHPSLTLQLARVRLP